MEEETKFALSLYYPILTMRLLNFMAYGEKKSTSAEPLWASSAATSSLIREGKLADIQFKVSPERSVERAMNSLEE